MLVCHCKAVYERRIREAIALGARDEFDIAEACAAGTGCGGCVPAISRLLGDCADCPMAATSAATTAAAPAGRTAAVSR